MLGINTASETHRYTQWDNLKRILQVVAPLLYDLKDMDDTLHRNVTEFLQ